MTFGDLKKFSKKFSDQTNKAPDHKASSNPNNKAPDLARGTLTNLGEKPETVETRIQEHIKALTTESGTIPKEEESLNIRTRSDEELNNILKSLGDKFKHFHVPVREERTKMWKCGLVCENLLKDLSDVITNYQSSYGKDSDISSLQDSRAYKKAYEQVQINSELAFLQSGKTATKYNNMELQKKFLDDNAELKKFYDSWNNKLVEELGELPHIPRRSKEGLAAILAELPHTFRNDRSYPIKKEAAQLLTTDYLDSASTSIDFETVNRRFNKTYKDEASQKMKELGIEPQECTEAYKKVKTNSSLARFLSEEKSSIYKIDDLHSKFEDDRQNLLKFYKTLNDKLTADQGARRHENLGYGGSTDDPFDADTRRALQMSLLETRGNQFDTDTQLAIQQSLLQQYSHIETQYPATLEVNAYKILTSQTHNDRDHQVFLDKLQLSAKAPVEKQAIMAQAGMDEQDWQAFLNLNKYAQDARAALNSQDRLTDQKANAYQTFLDARNRVLNNEYNLTQAIDYLYGGGQGSSGGGGSSSRA